MIIWLSKESCCSCLGRVAVEGQFKVWSVKVVIEVRLCGSGDSIATYGGSIVL